MRTSIIQFALLALFALSTASAADATIKLGEKLSLVGSAEANPPATFVWFLNGQKIAEGNSYTIVSAKESDAGSYTLEATNMHGVGKSPAFVVVVDTATAPVIAMAPLDAALLEGSSLSLSVVATGSPAPTYQWKKNGTDIPGATTSRLTFSSINRTDSGSYSVVVSNVVGSVTSPAAVIDVQYPPSAPVITRPLSNVTVLHKSDLALAIEYTAEPPSSISWKKGTAILQGKTEPSLLLRDVTPGAAGTYEVTVKNSSGSVSSKAVVTVAKR